MTYEILLLLQRPNYGINGMNGLVTRHPPKPFGAITACLRTRTTMPFYACPTYIGCRDGREDESEKLWTVVNTWALQDSLSCRLKL